MDKFLFTDPSVGIIAIAIAVPLVAVLCSVSSCLLTALATYFYITRKKIKGHGEEEMQDQASSLPLYDKHQDTGTSCDDDMDVIF